MGIRTLFSTALFGFAVTAFAASNTIDGMTPFGQPKELAPGIWSFTIGKTGKEVAYTSLADRPPRMEVLSTFPKKPFPFSDNELRYTIADGFNIGLRIPAGADEDLFGFGLQLNGIKQNKRVLDLRVDHWGKGDGRTHAPVPFYLSSKGYGIFINTARPLKVYAQVGNRWDDPDFPQTIDRNPPSDEKQPGKWDSQPRGEAVEIQANAQGLEVIVFTGDNLQEIVSKYNLYMGGGALPPLWGLGFWHRVPSKYNAEQCNAEVAEFAKRKIPLDVLGLEPGWQTKSYPCTFEWQPKRFADPKGFTQNLLKQGVRLNLWENPYISPYAKLYKKMLPYSCSHTVWLGIVPDYMTPQARDLIVEQHRNDHIAIGVSGYKADETDGYDKWLWPDHATFPSGVSGAAMRQIYGLSLQKAYSAGIYRPMNQRSMGLTRSSCGAASAYSNAIYSDAYNHAEYITGVSAGSLCGILWCPEIRSGGNPTEWLCRMQTAVFSPVAQLNAWASGTKPWSHESKTDQVRELIELRMRLLPYLYTAYADYWLKGVPPFRAMILEGGKTKETVKSGKLDDTANPYEASQSMQVTDQYMMGPSILVAPFYVGKSNKRTVDLPPGDWYDFYTGKFVGNNGAVTVENDGKMPLFVKDGALIPMLTESVMNTDAVYGKSMEIRHYGKAKGSFTLYEDDGKTFDHEKGKYRLRTFTAEQGKMIEKVEKSDAPAMYGNATLVPMTK